jgi:hypothetical protein
MNVLSGIVSFGIMNGDCKVLNINVLNFSKLPLINSQGTSKINISKHLKTSACTKLFLLRLALLQNFQEILHSKDEKTSFKLSTKRNYGSLFYDRNKDI